MGAYLQGCAAERLQISRRRKWSWRGSGRWVDPHRVSGLAIHVAGPALHAKLTGALRLDAEAYKSQDIVEAHVVPPQPVKLSRPPPSVHNFLRRWSRGSTRSMSSAGPATEPKSSNEQPSKRPVSGPPA